MSSFKWLNNLLLLENFFGIYRTYSNQKNRKKYLIIFHVFIQIMLNTIIIIYQQYLLLRKNDIDQLKLIYILFIFCTYMNGVSSIVTGICYSRDFLSYLRSISSVYDYFLGYSTDVSTLTNSIKKSIYIVCSFILFTISFFAYRSTIVLTKYIPSDSIITLVTLMLSQLVMRMIVLFQYLLLYVVIIIVVLLIKCLNSLIPASHMKVGSNGDISDNQGYITREQIQEWVELYRNLVNCCEKVTLCFGRQYIYSLVISIPQYVMVAYQLCCRYLYKAEFSDDGARIIIQLSNVAVMLLPLIAAQLTINQGAKLHRVFVRLYNKMIIGSAEAEAKLIKDVIRLIKKNPLEIKLSSKSHAGMYMLPAVFTLTVNYLIVTLQFNHVI